MEYEEMSDFEINKWIFRLTKKETMRMFGSKIYLNSDWGLEFNPCNNPSDAWPIIVESNISVNKHFYDDEMEWSDEWEAVWDKPVDVGPRNVRGSKIFHDDTNPLRAAMIVFLRMQEK